MFNLTCIVNECPQFFRVTSPGDYVIPIKVKSVQLTFGGVLSAQEQERRQLEELLKNTVSEVRYFGCPLPIYLPEFSLKFIHYIIYRI